VNNLSKGDWMKRIVHHLVLGLSVVIVAQAHAGPGIQVHPATFVGKAGECGPTAGTAIVTAAWLDGAGLPDDAAADNDRRQGLLLSKNGPTADCSAAAAWISGVKNLVIGPGFTFGYDARIGTHCSGGAPRFNVRTTTGLHFVGACTNATTEPAPADTQWIRATMDPFDPAHSFPAFQAGEVIESVQIIFDEGTDAGPGAGLAVIDNIRIGDKISGARNEH
jgi:hypothetical protein